METNKTHKTNELSERFEISDRYVQKIAKELGIAKTKREYLFSDKDILLIGDELTNRSNEQRTVIELEADEEDIIEFD